MTRAGRLLALARSRPALLGAGRLICVDGPSGSGKTTLADELTSVATLLTKEHALNSHLAEPTDEPAAKERLVERLFADKLAETSLDLLKTAVAQRWSADGNLVDALEHIARLALLVRAERNEQSEEMEEQLFRVGRVLDAESRLNRLLSDPTVPADKRVELLDKVLQAGGGVDDTAAALLRQTIELLRGELADDVTHLLVVEHGDTDDIGGSDVGDVVGQRRTQLGQRGHRLGADVEHDEAARPVDKPLRHRRALIAQTDIPQLQRVAHLMICPPSTLKI